MKASPVSIAEGKKGKDFRMFDRSDGEKRLLQKVEADGRVLALILFGSAARAEETPGSDVDYCLVLLPGKYKPVELSRIKLEYLSQFEADIHVLQQLPMYIRKGVLRDGKVVFCRDMDALYDVAFTFIREHADYEHIYRDYLGELSRAGERTGTG